MTFFEQLQSSTSNDRAQLLDAPIIAAAMAGLVNRQQYLNFLERAFHHVKHTVPLLMACGARLPDEQEWLRTAVAHYVDEEIGHHEWILSDIAAAGGDADAVRAGVPDMDTEVLVAYAYDMVMRKNPVGFFGMVYVLEGTSVTLATAAAQALRTALDLSPNAFTYLSSHGSLDVEHVGHLQALVNRLERSADRSAVERGAQVVYRLYGNVLRGIDHACAS